MILKFKLTTHQFAGLAEFVASEDNGVGFLKEMFPERNPQFTWGHSDDKFATILKSSPTKEGDMDVAVLTSEYFKRDYHEKDECVPHQYIDRLFHAANLFPITKTHIWTKVVDCDALPKIYFEGLRADRPRSVHLKMGRVRLEKTPDEKLFANGVEIIRRPLPPAVMEGDPFPGEDEQAKRRLVNACVADALLRDPALIPVGWGGSTYFRGTMFDDGWEPTSRNRHLFVRGICNGGYYRNYEWCTHNGCVGEHNWGDKPLEAVLAT